VKLNRIAGAAVAMTIAMAFIGTSSALANTLNIVYCKSDELECGSANRVTHLHEVDTSWGFVFSFGRVGCQKLFLADVENPGGLAHLTLSIKGFYTHSGCETESGAECEVNELNGPVLLTVMKTGEEEGEIINKIELLVDCSTFPHCVYNGGGLKEIAFGGLLKGPNGEARGHKQGINKVSGFFCPSTAEVETLSPPLSVTYIKS
jgi:hypothetical protein